MQTQKSSPRGQLLSQYVTARIPTMTGIDIGLFDYDRHNALYYFIMNADEQIYMRYGGRDATSPDAYLDLKSLEIALQLGLEQHELYTQDRLEKQAPPAPFFPSEIKLLRQDMRRRRCVECHLIADYQTLELESAGKLNKLENMYVFPDIRVIGIQLNIPKGLVVRDARGAAKQAGMQSGDLIVGINGKPVLTFGDLQHFYNKVPRDSKQVRMSVVRNGVRQELTLDLPKEWWWTDLYHRYWSVEPILFFSSMALSDEEKRNYDLDVAGFASEVTRIQRGNWYRNTIVRTLGELRRGDIIYSVDGIEVDELTRNFETYIKLNKTAGAKFTVQFLRGREQMETTLWTGRQRFRK
ncbi:MAG: PDZ domain-containing protein [Candidatus Marinimicrobia bacterium]|nr:PDZ domain-containing protein [Candidatus Neomarinimicrobiota bacterium]